MTATEGSGCTGTLQVTITGTGGAPLVPSAVAGPNGACRNTSAVFSVTSVPGVSYIWTLPSNATGSSSTSSITVTFANNYQGGFVCVAATNSCGTSSTSCIPVPVLTVKPAVPAAINGPSIVCGPIVQTYSVAPVSGALSYTWVVTGPGVSIQSGNGTNAVQVVIPAGFGQGSIRSINLN